MFVMRGLDTYFEAKKQGKVDLYMQHIKEPGTCMEDLGMKFQLFEEKNLIDAKPMDKEEAAELKRIAEEPTESELPRRADQIICDTLTTLHGYEEKDEWDDDLATALKAKLIGKSCQMIELEKAGNGTKFKPIVKQGKPVIKQLTAKDLDILGPACFKNLNGL